MIKKKKKKDQITLQVDDPNHDEIKQYVQRMYIAPIETVWSLFEFEIYEE
jgi:hypothetical protein